jgi:two-component system response regulator (stage 0 sporulation protein F)
LPKTIPITVGEVLDIREAATFLGVHEQTIRKLARRGAIPAFKVGRGWRFRKEALLAWSERQGRAARRCSVLVVDDDPQLCAATRRMIEDAGCAVRTATDARTGLEMALGAPPDLIVLDLVMPGLNGPQFLLELRKTLRGVPVVVVTGYPDSELMLQASQHAPILVLAKPVDAELLVRTVRAVHRGAAAEAGE